MLRAVRVPLAVWQDRGLPGWRSDVAHGRLGGMPRPPAAMRLRLLTELGACVSGLGDCQAVGESQRMGIVSRDARITRGREVRRNLSYYSFFRVEVKLRSQSLVDCQSTSLSLSPLLSLSISLSLSLSLSFSLSISLSPL